ncbi:hypothetical protein NERG_00644 [Nematocida ausubeli]|uniref:ABC transporter domain-containing protein n=1 Tax=Nematocida ausubeli (strain ATCC PRA-371 / ERTm2) TaxID=1913371 RepID=H8ZAP5_NEMA1|nr:hypothetical protein NERG_00644 [Nematocida ausubeli]
MHKYSKIKIIMENLNITDNKNEHIEIDIGNLPIEDIELNSIAEEEKSAGILMWMDKYERITEKGVPLLKRVSFSLPEGKMTALLGLSGDEKSALMDGMAGMCSPSHKTYGEVYVKGKRGALEKRKAEEWFSRVNYTQQSMIEYKNISVYDILWSIAKCYGKKEQDVDDYMSMLRISKVKKVHFNNLSKSEQKRVIVAAELLSQKELNIWDEPLTGLDSEIVHVILSTMKSAQNTNLVAMHQVSEDIMNQFDLVLLMHKSTIVYSGPAEEMQAYFTEKGIEFPSDMFYVNYLMQLCAENSENHIDIHNIEILDVLANEIIHSPCGEKAGKNNLFTSSQLKLSSTGIVEILKRSLYMDRFFMGESIIGSLLIVLFGCIISTISIYASLYYFSFDKYPSNVYYLCKNIPALRFPKIISILKERVSESNYEKDLKPLYITASNAGWVSILTKIFKPAILFAGSVCCLVIPSSFLNISFFKNCRNNIQGKQFTAGDFIVAQAIDIMLKKTLSLWVVLVGMYFLAYSLISEDMRGGIIIGHTLPILLLLFASILIGMYSLVFHFAPIPVQKFSLIVGVYIGIVHLLPSMIFNGLSKSQIFDYSYLFKYSISIFIDDYLEFFNWAILEYNMESHIVFKVALSIFNAIISLVRFFLHWCIPAESFSQILEKSALYMNAFPFQPIDTNDIYSVWTRYFTQNINDILTARTNQSDDRLVYTDDMIKIASDAINDLNSMNIKIPHEAFDNSKPLPNELLEHIVLSMLRFLAPACILLVVSAACMYIRMQPKLRN